MHKQKPPARDSRFVSLRHAVTETGLSYSMIYGAVKRGAIQSLSTESDARAVIYLQRSSLNTWIDQRLSRREAA